MSRRYIRERAMKILFEIEISKNNSDDVLNKEIERFKNKRTKGEIDFLKKLINTAMDNQVQIDGIIEKYTKNWSIKRLGKVDLTILRLALTEMMYIEDVPNKVSINEAVELGKKYSTYESPSYINGVLDKAFKSVQGDNI